MASSEPPRPPMPPPQASVSSSLSTSTSARPLSEDNHTSGGQPSSSTTTMAPHLAIPDISPPRPSSAPPGGLDGSSSSSSSSFFGPPSPLLQQPTQPMGNLNLHGVATNAVSSPDHQQQHLHEDEKTSGRASRFVGNMLITRIGRASWQSLESTARLPFYLSPWGDNLPFTLPNLRKRDVALAGVAHFGLDALGASAVTVVESAFTHAASATVEQTADEGISKVSGRLNKQGHVVRRRVGMDSLTLRIKHKLIGEGAELVFQGVKDTEDRVACAKGWFCPYLYASGREPVIARSQDWSMAQLLRPRLAADASIAPTLLSSCAESDMPVVSPFGCPWEDPSFAPNAPCFPRFRRMAVFLTGISPYRYLTTQSAWSHSRIPNEARITFHLFTHAPIIVFPIKDQSPVMAWSPWTVAQMFEPAWSRRYSVDRHVQELLSFIEMVIDEDVVRASSPELEKNGWRGAMESCLRSMLSAVLHVPDAIKETAKDCCELERTGVVAFRY